MPLTLKRPLVFFDLETTGTKVDEDRIIEISLLKLFPDAREEVTTLLVNPTIPISPEASAIHGIKDEDVADKSLHSNSSLLRYLIYSKTPISLATTNTNSIFPLSGQQFGGKFHEM